MNDIKIISYNCRGLHDAKKRADVFQFLKERDASIYCLQDVHFTSNMEKHLYSQWNSNCYFSYSRSNARGVAILFSRNIDVKVHQTHVDENGNYIILDLTFNSKRFSLINIYGPNIDQPEFYQNIIRIIDMVGNETVIWCGDFNLVLDVDLDYYNYKSKDNNKKSRAMLLTFIQNKRLCDPYRELNGNIKRYTWRRTNPLQQARLDFFLLSPDLLSQVRSCDISLSYRSDHSLVMLSIDFSNVTHGKGLWKFNNSLLQDINYLECINKKIEEGTILFANL